MTNAEKYLKDGVVADNFAEDFLRYLIKLDSGKLYKGKPTVDNLKEFLNLPAKPALSEDEKVVLNCASYSGQNIIFRDDCGTLWTRDVDGQDNCFCQFNYIFIFIKERRRI